MSELRTVKDMITHARSNDIVVRKSQEKKSEIIKLLKQYSLINIINGKVYTVAQKVGKIPTPPPLPKVGRPTPSLFKKQNLSREKRIKSRLLIQTEI